MDGGRNESRRVKKRHMSTNSTLTLPSKHPSHNLNPPRCRGRLKMRVSQIKVVSDGLECSDALESIQVDTGEMSLAMDPGAPWVSVTVRILF